MENSSNKCKFFNYLALKSSYARSKQFKLPVNFHENIITLENKLLFDMSFEIISQLMDLYRVRNNKIYS